jgi:gamma-butyrobetaine dioxygenase
LLIADNYRVLHGRTSFKTSKGNRFLQGLYIDHDSMESKYKIMKAKNSE